MSLMNTGIRFSRFYYGWIIVGVAMASMAFWFGIRASFSVFYVTLLEHFSWSRGETAGVQSMALITYTIMAPIVGWLIDRFVARRIIVPGIFLLALGLILCASIKTLGQFYFVYGVLVGTGVTSIGIVSYTVILAHWFEKKRGLANGLAVCGMGLGAFIFVPPSQYLISLWGWRPTFAILGGLVLIILLPLNAFLLRHRPQELGLYPDGINEGEQPKQAQRDLTDLAWPESDSVLKSAFRTRRFWYLVIFPFLAATVMYIILVHHVRFLVDKGIDKTMAAFIFGLIGITSLPFRIFWGWLSDYIGREKTYTLGAICIFIGICSLILLEISGDTQLVYPFIIMFGAGWAVTAPMFMSVAADLYQGKQFGLIFGILQGVVGIGGAFGAWLPGFIFDRTGSYQWAFGFAAAMAILSCLFVWLAAPRKARINNQTPPGKTGDVVCD